MWDILGFHPKYYVTIGHLFILIQIGESHDVKNQVKSKTVKSEIDLEPL